MPNALEWPENSHFALTMCDDTDNGTLENLRPIYAMLRDAGIRITKTVWSLPNVPGDRFTGQSLSDSSYADWVRHLAASGFEIGWHGARSGGSKRDVVAKALDIFKRELGGWPRTYANHANNIENIYWGAERFNNAFIRNLFLLAQERQPFEGSRPQSEFFWADLCGEKIRYVRDFTFSDIITSDADPWTPYWDSKRPLVRSWFSSTDAADADMFCKVLTSTNLDRLEKSGGFCILYVHLASGFVVHNEVRRDVAEAIGRIKRKKGWYAPVASLLQHIEIQRGLHRLTPKERNALEWRWFREHVRHGIAALHEKLGRILIAGKSAK